MRTAVLLAGESRRTDREGRSRNFTDRT